MPKARTLTPSACQVPDGVVAFFVSYMYMDGIISKWHDMGILQEILQHKLIFIETQVGGGAGEGREGGRGTGGRKGGRREEGRGEEGGRGEGGGSVGGGREEGGGGERGEAGEHQDGMCR